VRRKIQYPGEIPIFKISPLKTAGMLMDNLCIRGSDVCAALAEDSIPLSHR
jgi:hypothetical protein